MPTTQETDGFQVKRPGDVNVKCTLLLMLDHQVCVHFSLIMLGGRKKKEKCCIACSNIYSTDTATSVQTGSSLGSSAGCAHTDAGQHHASSLALHQEQQAARQSWERVHQLQSLFQTGNVLAWKAAVRLLITQAWIHQCLLVEMQSDAKLEPLYIKHELLSHQILDRSSAVLEWGSLRFPWNWPACSSILTPSLLITWLGK